MFDSAREAFLYAVGQWSGMGLIVFGIAYVGARMGLGTSAGLPTNARVLRGMNHCFLG
jgi:hypothetical protein